MLQLLRACSGAFQPGVLTALVGSSGAGKTTLMDVIAGRKTSAPSQGLYQGFGLGLGAAGRGHCAGPLLRQDYAHGCHRRLKTSAPSHGLPQGLGLGCGQQLLQRWQDYPLGECFSVCSLRLSTLSLAVCMTGMCSS